MRCVNYKLNIYIHLVYKIKWSKKLLLFHSSILSNNWCQWFTLMEEKWVKKGQINAFISPFFMYADYIFTSPPMLLSICTYIIKIKKGKINHITALQKYKYYKKLIYDLIIQSACSSIEHVAMEEGKKKHKIIA